MNLFKKLFSAIPTNKVEKTNHNLPQEVFTTNYFDERYIEEKLDRNDIMVDGSFRMLSSYFIDTKNDQPIAEPIYHPKNLDAAVQQGMGFYHYCKLFEQDDKQIGLTLTLAFSYYMIENYDFKFYKDKTPELPLRFMTLKYNKDGGIISLYPFEYSLKVLNGEASFTELVEKVEKNIKEMPTASEVMENLKNNLK